ncbi:MAG: DUF11 domain-containing protein [Planctomycetes bacterium]|nr:DUF11 domain-containing protein [Planctomycetota bacterium]
MKHGPARVQRCRVAIALVAALVGGCASYHDHATRLTIDDHEETIRHLEDLLARSGGGVQEIARLRAEIERLRSEIDRLRGQASPLGPGGPVVLVEGPAAADAGGEVLYRVTVSNPSSQSIVGVDVVGHVPEGCEFLSASGGGSPGSPEGGILWKAGSLASGESKVYELRVRAARTGAFQVCASAVAGWRHCADLSVVQSAIACRVESPGQVVVGRPFPVGVVLENPGNGTTRAVQASVTLSEGLALADPGTPPEWRLDAIPPGGSIRNSWNVVARAAGRHSVAIRVDAAGGIGSDCGSELDAVAPGLALAKSGPGSRYVGQPVEFRITATNPGSAPATAVRIADPLPRGFEFASAGQGGRFDPARGMVEWDLGALAPGEAKSVDLVLTPRLEGDFENVATATAAEGLTAEARAPIRILQAQAMQLAISDQEDPVEVGGETSYVIEATNEGRTPVTGVRLRLRLPEEGALVSATGPTPYAQDPQSGEIAFEPVATLPPGGRIEVRVVVRAESAGSAVCTAWLSFQEFSREILAQEGTHFYK